ncbi:unnamed protein product [Ilex paraguariensis]|uniref:Secreted protein n=1 Tax=Ilex paraguariensis TaxID=185542 RepID=A0ABC8SPP7_9AQUA
MEALALFLFIRGGFNLQSFFYDLRFFSFFFLSRRQSIVFIARFVSLRDLQRDPCSLTTELFLILRGDLGWFRVSHLDHCHFAVFVDASFCLAVLSLTSLVFHRRGARDLGFRALASLPDLASRTHT